MGALEYAVSKADVMRAEMVAVFRGFGIPWSAYVYDAARKAVAMALAPANEPFASETAERATFEAWAVAIGLDVERHGFDYYPDARTQWAWSSWMARVDQTKAQPRVTTGKEVMPC